MGVLDEGGEAGFGAGDKHLVCARAQIEESGEVEGDERQELARESGHRGGQEVGRRPGESGALGVESRGDGARRRTEGVDEVGGECLSVPVAEGSEAGQGTGYRVPRLLRFGAREGILHSLKLAKDVGLGVTLGAPLEDGMNESDITRLTSIVVKVSFGGIN